jgi:hypothetical protein
VRSKKFEQISPKICRGAELSIDPPSTRLRKQPFWTCLPACRQAGRQAGWTISSFSLAANYYVKEDKD